MFWWARPAALMMSCSAAHPWTCALVRKLHHLSRLDRGRGALHAPTVCAVLANIYAARARHVTGCCALLTKPASPLQLRCLCWMRRTACLIWASRHSWMRSCSACPGSDGQVGCLGLCLWSIFVLPVEHGSVVRLLKRPCSPLPGIEQVQFCPHACRSVQRNPDRSSGGPCTRRLAQPRCGQLPA